jgi:hypothetical protein
MHYAFLCHAPSDGDTARELGHWLEVHTPCAIRLAECGAGCADDLIEAADQAMSANAVVLLLSPASVPEKWVRSRWEPVLLEQPAQGGAALASVVLAECKFPELLRRRDCFPSDLAGRRALKRWLLARFPQVESVPAGKGGDGVAAAEVEELRVRLADAVGTADGVPRDVALAFVRECAAEFEGAVWVDGTRRTSVGIAGDLGEALGLTLEGPPEDSLERLRDFCAGRRLLVVFDNCGQRAAEITGRSSVLRTAPHAGPEAAGVEELARRFAAWAADPGPCLAALRDVAGAIEGHAWREVREIASGAAALLGRRRRAAELLELAELALPRAAAAGDTAAVRRFEWERDWILQAWGRPGPVTAPVMPPEVGEQLALEFPAG